MAEDVLVVLTGDMTSIEAGHLKKDIADALAGATARQLIIDMAQVPFIDSAGLGVLVSAYKRMRQLDGRVRLRGVQPRVRSVLDTTRMSQIFEIEDAPAGGGSA